MGTPLLSGDVSVSDWDLPSMLGENREPVDPELADALTTSGVSGGSVGGLRWVATGAGSGAADAHA